MAAFGDWAKNYYESGLSVLPVNPEKKSCFVKGWTEKFSKNFPSDTDQDHYIEKYSDHDLGLATGGVSKIVAIDFDYTNMGDSDWIESLIIGALPPTSVIKKGSKGWTRFYQTDGSVKNRSIDRMGSRMIDVLSTGRLTVLPPSRHKDGMLYQWIGSVDLLNADDEDMGVLTNQYIDQLMEISEYGQDLSRDFIKKKARHDAVVGHILRLSDQAKDLEDLIQGVIQWDIQNHKDDPKGPYLSDKRYLKERTTYEFTKSLCERVCEWKTRRRADQGLNWTVGKYPRLHSEGKKSSTNYDDFKSFFEFNYPRVRYDKIRRTTYYYSDRAERWEPIDNIREVIESQASEVGLSPSYVNRHLQRWVSTLQPQLCIDVPRWKGRDVVSEMVDRLSIQNIKKEHATELFKEWGANIFRRLNSKGTKKLEQNTMVILKGGQGIGKDSWINFMFGSFGSYFSEIEIQDRKIENYQTISDLLVANIPEFDETHRVSLSTLKSLITSPGATFRAAYARKSDFVPFYVSYISSCNFDHILRDSSGNRRFMIFDLESIRWGYQDTPQDQILAQFHHLYLKDYKASTEAHRAMNEYIKGHSPEDIDELIAEECYKVIKMHIEALPLTLQEKRDHVYWTEVSEPLHKVASRYRVSIRRIQSVLKNFGFAQRNKTARFYSVNDSKLKTH